MALEDYLSGLPNIFMAQPGALSGILTDEESKKLQNQSLLKGLIGTGLTYLAQPKNQNYGSALPYLGKAFLGGMQSAQGTYDTATQNLINEQKIKESRREAESAKLLREQQDALLLDERVKDNPTLKALVAKGDFSKVADIISPKPGENDYDRYSFAYYNKPFKDLTQDEKKDTILKVQEDKKANATQISFNQPTSVINPKTGKAELVQFPNKPGEKPIFTGLEKSEPELKLKPVPAGPATAFSENNTAIKKIDDAIAKVEAASDDTFGVKNYLGGAITQRIDPKGTEARAAVAGVGGQKYHDLSGAAVAIQEAARLAPYIPQVTDTKQKVLENLRNLKQEYTYTNDTLTSTFNQDQGYRPLNVKAAQSTQSTQSTTTNQQQNIPVPAKQNRAYIGNRAIIVKGNKWVYEDTGEVAQ
jgi:hypothetical protein